MRLGSFGIWLWARIVQATMVLWWLASLRNWDLFELLILLMIAELSFLFDPFAHGNADEKGISYRRYLKLHFVPWEKVDSVVWKPRSLAGVRVLLKVEPAWRRKLDFGLNPTLPELIAEFRDKKPPQIVVWLQQHVNSTPPAAETSSQ